MQVPGNPAPLPPMVRWPPRDAVLPEVGETPAQGGRGQGEGRVPGAGHQPVRHGRHAVGVCR